MISPFHRFYLRHLDAIASPRLITGEGPASEGIADRYVTMAPAAPGEGVSAIIDTETLDKTPRSIITEIGAVIFRRSDFQIVETLDIRLDIYDQLATRQVSKDTIEFHRKKGTLPDKATGTLPFIAAAKLQDLIQRHNPVRVWIQGTCFERPLIQDFFEDLGQSLPWDFLKSADARTVWNLAFPGQRHPSRPHHALADALATLPDIINSLQKLGALHAC